MGIPSSCDGSICRRDSLTCSKTNSSLLSRIQCLHCLLSPSPSFSFSMVECWFAPRLLLGNHRFHDAYGRLRGDDLGQTKSSLGEERSILRLGPLLTSWADEHHHVEPLAWVRCIAGRQNHFDDQDAAGRCHGASAVA